MIKSPDSKDLFVIRNWILVLRIRAKMELLALRRTMNLTIGAFVMIISEGEIANF